MPKGMMVDFFRRPHFHPMQLAQRAKNLLSRLCRVVQSRNDGEVMAASDKLPAQIEEECM